MISHIAFFGDTSHVFTLTPREIVELERLSGVGIGAFCQRISRRDARYSDLRDVIRLGLIGGGLDPQDAEGMVATYVDGRPLERTFLLAIDIVAALYFGASEETIDIDMGTEPDEAQS